jgi:hypothetical protein
MACSICSSGKSLSEYQPRCTAPSGYEKKSNFVIEVLRDYLALHFWTCENLAAYSPYDDPDVMSNGKHC